MPRLMSLRAYARHRRERGLVGGTLNAVQRAIASGRITPINGKIDPEVADIQWTQKTDVDQQARGASGGHAPKAVSPGPARPAGPQEGRDGYFDVKARRELAEAQLAELELRKQVGELVDAAGVKNATFTAFRALRDRLLGIPDRIAAIVAAESDPTKVHAALDSELKTALREVAQELQAA